MRVLFKAREKGEDQQKGKRMKIKWRQKMESLDAGVE